MGSPQHPVPQPAPQPVPQPVPHPLLQPLLQPLPHPFSWKVITKAAIDMGSRINSNPISTKSIICCHVKIFMFSLHLYSATSLSICSFVSRDSITLSSVTLIFPMKL
ncbi:MAG: hypothetical protein EHM77_06670 [Planctomycetaceae bacterium]|nr:MAG: hypothetical protein EHM77_06670 [Planctomycetaceae bacterium]